MRALAFVLAAVVILVFDLWAFLRMPWGASILAGQIERQLSDAVDGTLRIGRLGTFGAIGFRLQDVLVLDPDDAPVIAVRDLRMRLEPFRLLRGELAVEIRIAGGRMALVQLPKYDDVNVGVAFAPEEKKPKPPRRRRIGLGPSLPPRPPMPIVLRRLQIDDTAFVLVPAPEARRQVLVRGIAIRASGAWDERGAFVGLALAAETLEPTRAPLDLVVSAAFAANWLEALRVDLRLGDSALFVRGQGHMRALAARIMAHGQLGAAEARALGIPLGSNLDLLADFRLDWDGVLAALRLAAEEGAVVVDGGYDWHTSALFGQLILASIDPSAWIDGGPPGELGGSARLAGTAPDDLRLDFELHEGGLLGHGVGPASLSARLVGRRLEVAPSALLLPGAHLELFGSAAEEALDLHLELRSHDLAATTALAGALAGETVPRLAGRGRARLDLGGTAEAPQLGARLDFPRLAWEGRLFRNLELEAALRYDADGLPTGRLVGSIASLGDDRLQARGLVFELERASGGAFRLDLSGVSLQGAGGERSATRLRASGNLRPGTARLDDFRFDYPEGWLRSEAPARFHFDGGRLAVDDLALLLRGGGGLRVRGGLTGQRIDLDLQGRGLRLDELPQALLPERLAGVADLEARLEGTTRAPQGTVAFRLRDLRWGELADLAASGDVGFEGGRARGAVRAALGGAGVVEASFDGPVDLAGAPAEAPFRVEILAGPLDLAGLGAALGAPLPEGEMVGRLVGSGTAGNPDLDLDLLVSGLALPEAPRLPPMAGRLRGRLEGGQALAHAEAWTGDRRVLEITASAPLDPRRLRHEAADEVERMLHSDRSEARGAIRGLELGQVGALFGQPDLAGAMVAELEVRGPIVDPRGEIRFEARAGPVGPVERLALEARVHLLPERSSLQAAIAVEDQPPATIRAAVEAPLRTLLDGTAPLDSAVELELEIPRSALDTLGEKAAERRPRGLVAALGARREVGGTLRAHGSFRGTLGRLPGSLRVVAEDLVFRGVPLGDIELFVEQEERLQATLAAIDRRAGTLLATARLDDALSPRDLIVRGSEQFRRMRAAVEVDAVDLSLAPLAIVPAINRASGALSFSARAEGPLFELDPVGEVRLRDGFVEQVGGPRYEKITFDARFAGDRIVAARLEARAPGRGRLEAEGRLERLVGPNPFAFEVRSEQFPIGGPGGVAARITGVGRLEGTWARKEGLKARLAVPEARILLPLSSPRELQPLSHPEDVVIVTGPEAFLREERERRMARQAIVPVEIRVDAPRRIFVVGSDVEAELGTQLVLRRDPAGDLVAQGTVRARRGSVRVLGRTFELEEAAATWGGPLENPQLSLSARYQVRDITAWVDVTGTASSPQVTLRSEPPLPESQIALLIAAGRTSLPGQTEQFEPEPTVPTQVDAASAAVSVAGSFAAQQLKRAVGPRLPLDVLTLETVGEGTRLEAGTYVSQRLYLGYLRNFLPREGENANEVRAEYELSRTVSVESRVGDRGAAGVDLVWEKRIATPAQQRARREEQAR